MDDHSNTPSPAGRGAAHPWPPVRVAAAVVWKGERVLLTQRPPGGPHPLMWELPGGKLEAGETPERALVRELREELGVAATPGERLGESRHTYAPDRVVEITFVRCELADPQLNPSVAVHAVRWMRPAEIDLNEVLAADRAFITGLADATPAGGTVTPPGGPPVAGGAASSNRASARPRPGGCW